MSRGGPSPGHNDYATVIVDTVKPEIFAAILFSVLLKSHNLAAINISVLLWQILVAIKYILRSACKILSFPALSYTYLPFPANLLVGS